MRVISGSARGLKLSSLDGLDTRPTLDRVKEALFSMLTPYIPLSHVLDLFAGSGALGIEALSRGSEHAVFVDMLPSALEIVKENVSSAHLLDKAEFHLSDACSYLKRCHDKFDIVFLDPPYAGGVYEKSLDALHSHLNDNAIIVVEWDSNLERPTISEKYDIIKERRYGRVMVTLLSSPERKSDG